MWSWLEKEPSPERSMSWGVGVGMVFNHVMWYWESFVLKEEGTMTQLLTMKTNPHNAALAGSIKTRAAFYRHNVPAVRQDPGTVGFFSIHGVAWSPGVSYHGEYLCLIPSASSGTHPSPSIMWNLVACGWRYEGTWRRPPSTPNPLPPLRSSSVAHTVRTLCTSALRRNC